MSNMEHFVQPTGSCTGQSRFLSVGGLFNLLSQQLFIQYKAGERSWESCNFPLSQNCVIFFTSKVSVTFPLPQGENVSM